MDLTGKLIFKVQLGQDIRRIPIHNEDITYDELILMMQRIYKGRLSPQDELLLKYKDEDNDLVTLADQSDLDFAIQCSRILRITIQVKGREGELEHGSELTLKQHRAVTAELRLIRDQVTHLLDIIGPAGASTHDAGDELSGGTTDNSHVADVKPGGGRRLENGATSTHGGKPVATAVPTSHKEFDPLNTSTGTTGSGPEGASENSHGLGARHMPPPVHSIIGSGSGLGQDQRVATLLPSEQAAPIHQTGYDSPQPPAVFTPATDYSQPMKQENEPTPMSTSLTSGYHGGYPSQGTTGYPPGPPPAPTSSGMPPPQQPQSMMGGPPTFRPQVPPQQGGPAGFYDGTSTSAPPPPSSTGHSSPALSMGGSGGLPPRGPPSGPPSMRPGAPYPPPSSAASGMPPNRYAPMPQQPQQGHGNPPQMPGGPYMPPPPMGGGFYGGNPPQQPMYPGAPQGGSGGPPPGMPAMYTPPTSYAGPGGSMGVPRPF